jgi:hypothetical protein
LDAASFHSPAVEDAAKGQNLDRQVTVCDHDPGPNGSHDFVLRDEIAVPLDEHVKYVECAGPDRDRDKSALLVGAKQTAAPSIETKPLELENPAADRLHAASPRERRILSTIKKILSALY